MEIKPTYEQLVGVLERSFYDGIVKVSEIGEITRGTKIDKIVYVTLKRDKRKRIFPMMHIAVSHAKCYDLEDLSMEKDGSVILSFTLHPDRY